MFKQNESICPFCGHRMKNKETLCPSCKKMIHMRWYKFIIWIQLIAFMIYYLWLGVTYIRGTIYGGNMNQPLSFSLYNAYPGLETIDKLQGMIFLIMAVFAYLIRNALMKRKKAAPQLYLLYVIVIILEPVVYRTITALLTKANFTGFTFSTVSTSLLLFICSYIYFRKRQRYFDQ